MRLNVERLDVELTGDDFFNFGLGLVQELVPGVAAVGEVGDEVAGLEGHVELKLGNVVAEVFALGGVGLGLHDFLREVLSYGCHYGSWVRAIATVL